MDPSGCNARDATLLPLSMTSAFLPPTPRAAAAGGIPGQPVEPDVPGPAPEPADTPPYVRFAMVR